MYLSQVLLTALTLATATLTTAAPHVSNTTSGPSLQRVSDIIIELEKQGALTWKNHTHGRTTTIFPHQQEAALSSLSKPTKRDGLGSWADNSPQAQDPVDSGMDIINFNMQPKGDNPPPLTKQMCQHAFDFLVMSQCQSGHHQGDSQGGQVEIGDDDDGAQMFELDPNDIKYGVTT
ncbi:MAG: hypothetical protein Q9157_003346 [Trypethelium eluteriae]